MSQYGGHSSRPVVEFEEGTSRTKQAMKEECDINNIMSQYVKTGMLNHVRAGVPVFADVSELSDYRTAIENVRAAEAYFRGLPAKVRASMNNDVTEFLEVIARPDAAEELEKRGLQVLEGRVAAKPPVEAPAAPEPKQETPPPAEPEGA